MPEISIQEIGKELSVEKKTWGTRGNSWQIIYSSIVRVSLPMAVGLELHDLQGRFQPKPFHDSMISLLMRLSHIRNVKETSQSDHSGGTLAVTLPLLDTSTAKNEAPLQWVVPVSWWVSHPTPYTPHSRGTRLPYWFHPRLPTAEPKTSGSIKHFIHGLTTH